MHLRSPDLSKPKVLITRRWPIAVEKAMAGSFNVTLNKDNRTITTEELGQALHEYDAICPSFTEPMPESLFKGESCKTRIIGNYTSNQWRNFGYLSIFALKSTIKLHLTLR